MQRQQEQRQQNFVSRVVFYFMGKQQENTNIDFDHHYHQLQLVQQRVMNSKRKISERIYQ